MTTGHIGRFHIPLNICVSPLAIDLDFCVCVCVYRVMSIVALNLYLVKWAGQFLQFTIDVHALVGTIVQLLNKDFHFHSKAFYGGDGTFLLEGQRRRRGRGEDMETIKWPPPQKKIQSIRFSLSTCICKYMAFRVPSDGQSISISLYYYFIIVVHVDVTWNVLLSLIQQQWLTVKMFYGDHLLAGSPSCISTGDPYWASCSLTALFWLVLPDAVGRNLDVNQRHLMSMYRPLLCVSRCRLDFETYDKVKLKV